MEFMGKQVQVFDKDPNVVEGEEEPTETPAPAANSGRGGGRGKKAKEVKQAFVKKEGFPYVTGASVRFTMSEGVVMLPFNSIKVGGLFFRNPVYMYTNIFDRNR